MISFSIPSLLSAERVTAEAPLNHNHFFFISILKYIKPCEEKESWHPLY
jgi:hypothetical protein